MNALQQVLDCGELRQDRTGTGTLSLFGLQMRFDLREGYPLVTTKKVNFAAVWHELLWFIKGDTHLKYLVENNVHIWIPDAHRMYKRNGGDLSLDEFKRRIKTDSVFLEMFGDLGPIYGKQWRSWDIGDDHCGVVDQLDELIHNIIIDPFSRRHIVSAWNVKDLPRMALPPCHVLFQFYVHTDGRLDCQLYQRSADMFLGVPFNIASYAALVHMVAQVTGLTPGYFVHTIGDAHIYLNHVDQVKEQLSREPRKLPKLHLNPEVVSIDDFRFSDFILEAYDPWPALKGELSVGE